MKRMKSGIFGVKEIYRFAMDRARVSIADSMLLYCFCYFIWSWQVGSLQILDNERSKCPVVYT